MKATGFSKTRPLQLFATFVGALVISYILVYLLLSMCGRYRSEFEGGLGHWEEFSVWAPFGFYDPNHSPPGSAAAEREMIIGTWRGSMVLFFCPLWIADTHYVHKSKYLRFIHETKIDGKTVVTTNNALSTPADK
jgi:hypothetical protein